MATKRARAEEAEEAEECRLCFEGEADGPLVQPCACCGTAKWIHNRCLEQWRRTSPKEDAAYRCGQCMDEYHDALSIELLSARLQAERANGQTTSFTLDTLGQELQAQGKHEEAEPCYREALELDREMLGSLHPDTLIAITNFAQDLQDQGKYNEAEPLFREALKGRRETLGDRHLDTLAAISNLGQLLQAQGDLTAAEPLQREALQARRETLGSRHQVTLNCVNDLGALLWAKGDLAAAEPLLRGALEVRRETLGNQHRVTLISINNLRQLLEEKGNPVLAAARMAVLAGMAPPAAGAGTAEKAGTAAVPIEKEAISVSAQPIRLQSVRQAKISRRC